LCGATRTHLARAVLLNAMLMNFNNLNEFEQHKVNACMHLSKPVSLPG
jgi:hypothetical protein